MINLYNNLSIDSPGVSYDAFIKTLKQMSVEKGIILIIMIL